MNKCEEIREKATNFFFGCDDNEKEGIAEHLDECSDCIEVIGKIYGQSKVIEEANHKSEGSHYAEQCLAGLLDENSNDDEFLNLVKEHVDSCKECHTTLDILRKKANTHAQIFCENPKHYLK